MDLFLLENNKIRKPHVVTDLWSTALSVSAFLPWLASLGWDAFPCLLSSLDSSEMDIAEYLSSVLLWQLCSIG